MTDTSTSIWKERHRLTEDRRKELSRRMQDYDAEHHKRMKALQARCGAIGHRGTWRMNGLGIAVETCNQCGARLRSESDGLDNSNTGEGR